MKSLGKPFQICLKNMFLNNFVKLLFDIHNFPCLKPLLKPLVFHSLLCVNRPISPIYTERIVKYYMLQTG